MQPMTAESLSGSGRPDLDALLARLAAQRQAQRNAAPVQELPAEAGEDPRMAQVTQAIAAQFGPDAAARFDEMRRRRRPPAPPTTTTAGQRTGISMPTLKGGGATPDGPAVGGSAGGRPLRGGVQAPADLGGAEAGQRVAGASPLSAKGGGAFLGGTAVDPAATSGVPGDFGTDMIARPLAPRGPQDLSGVQTRPDGSQFIIGRGGREQDVGAAAARRLPPPSGPIATDVNMDVSTPIVAQRGSEVGGPDQAVSIYNDPTTVRQRDTISRPGAISATGDFMQDGSPQPISGPRQRIAMALRRPPRTGQGREGMTGAAPPPTAGQKPDEPVGGDGTIGKPPQRPPIGGIKRLGRYGGASGGASGFRRGY